MLLILASPLLKVTILKSTRGLITEQQEAAKEKQKVAICQFFPFSVFLCLCFYLFISLCLCLYVSLPLSLSGYDIPATFTYTYKVDPCSYFRALLFYYLPSKVTDLSSPTQAELSWVRPVAWYPNPSTQRHLL